MSPPPPLTHLHWGFILVGESLIYENNSKLYFDKRIIYYQFKLL